MATRKKPLNKTNLVLLGLATALIGTYLLAGDKIIAYFKDFIKIVHKYGMIVSGDCNSELFHRLEATETDFRFLKILG